MLDLSFLQSPIPASSVSREISCGLAGFDQFAFPACDNVIASNEQPISFLRKHTDDSSEEARIKIAHGTTTLAFKFEHGVIVAVDSRATAGSYIGSVT